MFVLFVVTVVVVWMVCCCDCCGLGMGHVVGLCDGGWSLLLECCCDL